MSGQFDEGAGSELSADTILPPGSRVLYGFLAPPQGPDELGRVNDYKVRRVLGSGGMGIVFEAEDLVLHRTVALKFLRPELAANPTNRERFLREARAAAGLVSDHIVTVHHVGVAGDLPFMATQFLIGESLQDRLDRTRKIDVRTALVIVREVAMGLAAAHAIGLVHRDIKPANIWLESERPGGPFRRAKLLDFGLARHDHGETSLTASGMIIGTPDFMSPEQVEGLSVDHRADLFSLGAVFYTLLSGEPPFKARSAMAVLMAVTSRSVRPVAELAPEVPDSVARIVESLLEKDPANRPPSAAAVIQALESALTSLGPATPDPSSLRETPAPSSHLTALARRGGPSRRTILRGLGGAAVLGAAGLGALALFRRTAAEPLKVGILYSTSGPLASSEVPLLDSTLLAIEEVNRGGGVLGRSLVPIIADGNSDSNEFTLQSRKLLTEDRVPVIFGCWLSSSLRGVSKEVERHDGLLFFPIHYEGLSESPRVVCMGLCANQHLLPVLDFLTKTLGKRRLFLIGGSDVYSYATHALIRDWLAPPSGITVVGEVLLPFGTRRLDDTIAKIKAASPDAIVNTIDGSTNFEFFPNLRAAGLTPDKVPVVSVSVTELELRGIGTDHLAGHYLAASYFQSVDLPAGRAFREQFQAKYGKHQPVSDLMGSAYTSVKLWAKATKRAGSFEPSRVADAVRGMEIAGVSGDLKVDPDNLHMWRPWRIGRVQVDGTVQVVAESAGSVQPIPYPETRTREKWNEFLGGLFNKWGGRWEDPSKP